MKNILLILLSFSFLLFSRYTNAQSCTNNDKDRVLKSGQADFFSPYSSITLKGGTTSQGGSVYVNAGAGVETTQNGVEILRQPGHVYIQTANGPYGSTGLVYVKNRDGRSLTMDVSGAVKANKLIDKNNTSYYIDPSSSSTSIKVAGTIQSKEILVTQLNAENITVNINNVADYVFEEDYPLLSLEELAKYIEKNQHLPDVPPAEVLESTGMNVAEMNNLLLKKVEELTLYIIQLQKELNALKSSN